jgi:hypothetical protein
MEKIETQKEIEDDSDNEENIESELIETEGVELNNFEIKENDYLLVGIYGNGSAFLSSSLLVDFKNDNKAYKVKFSAKLKKDSTRPKKLIAELKQITLKNVSHLVLLIKQNFTNQSFKKVFEYLEKNGITYKRVAVFDGVSSTNFISLTTEGEQRPQGLFHLKNRKQSQANQLIKAQILPSPNSVSGFSAYLLASHDFKDIPCVVWVSVSNIYEICLESMLLFNDSGVTYEFLRNKLSEDYLKEHNITSANFLLREYNSYKNLVYS